jgi:hypothetical protein
VAKPGEDLTIHLYWFAEETPSQDYEVFLQLLPPDDTEAVVEAHSMPILGYGPTTRWEPGELVVDAHHLYLDEGIAPGLYRLAIGLSGRGSTQTLAVQQSPGQLEENRVVLMEVQVVQ